MIPPWTWHEHVNSSGEQALLFVISDKPILDSFNLYREEPHPERRQKPTRTFTPSGLDL